MQDVGERGREEASQKSSLRSSRTDPGTGTSALTIRKARISFEADPVTVMFGDLADIYGDDGDYTQDDDEDDGYESLFQGSFTGTHQKQ